MSSNHESFLKMIGLDVEAPADDSATQESAPEESPAEVSQGTQSATEWEMESPADEVSQTETQSQSQQTVELEEPAVRPADKYDDWGEFNEEATASESSSNWKDEGILEKTEKTLDASVDESSQAVEPTAVYTSEESLKVTEANRLTATEAHGPRRKTKTFSKAMTLTRDRTRHTVPYSTDALAISGLTDAPSSNGGDGTAHFDYSQQQQDFRIVVLDGKVNAQAFHLMNPPLRLGRDSQNEVVLDDVNASRFHAEIREQNGKMVIVDLGSTNGIKVNGFLVGQKELDCHDIVQIGDCVFEFLHPGVLSKGLSSAAAATASESSTKGGSSLDDLSRTRLPKKRIAVMAAGLLILLFMGYQAFLALRENAGGRIEAVISEEAKTEMGRLRAQLEGTSKQPLAEMDAEAVKVAFLTQIKQMTLIKYIPEAYVAQLSEMPSPILKSFVMDPELLPEVVKLGSNQGALTNALQGRLGRSIRDNKIGEAYVYAEALLVLDPTNEIVKERYASAKAILDNERLNRETGTNANIRLFYEYMEKNNNRFSESFDAGRFEQALDHAQRVAKALSELYEEDKQYEKIIPPELKVWNDRIALIEKKLEERSQKSKLKESNLSEGTALLEEIKSLMNNAAYSEAADRVEKFLTQYPDHPKRDEVYFLQDQMNQHLSQTLETTKQNIQSFLDAESFENAWKELYRFSDLSPKNPSLAQIRELIEKRAGPKASQYYNQARVFEFEADDLVAAEQYYKKTLEVADPRSELAKKAGRRYAEVKRRSIQ